MEQHVKIRLLVNFGYQRKEWILPFESLPQVFDITYLFYVYPSQEERVETQSRRVYWSDYQNAYEVIEDVKPDRMIFMDVTSGLAMAMNLACRHRAIPTYILQHGLYHNYKDYRARELKSKKGRASTTEANVSQKRGFSTLRFLKGSVKMSDWWSVLLIPFYFYLQRKEGTYFAGKKLRFKARKPDHYLCYTPQNATIHKELDGNIEARCKYIGNPELWRLHEHIQHAEGELTDHKYYLAIDQPFADNRLGEHILSVAEMQKFYSGLGQWCQENGALLKVKLHPESYHVNWLPQSENIEYIRQTDNIGGLIADSIGCFGFFSTLMLPSILHKPTTLFKVGESPLYDQVRKFGVAQVLSLDEIDKINANDTHGGDNDGFINHYFYQTEKDPVSLLAAILGKE